jgi:hypothetical protein
MTHAPRRTPMVAKTLTALAIAAGAALAWALPAGADVQLSSPPVAGVQVQPPATLGALGAVVTVPVVAVCAPGATSAEVEVQIAQRVAGNTIADGSGTHSVSCTGTLQTVNVNVAAQRWAFVDGVAFARGAFTVCDHAGCRSETDEREIPIVG